MFHLLFDAWTLNRVEHSFEIHRHRTQSYDKAMTTRIKLAFN